MPRYAAIDIGSNSIRMLAAETAPGSPPLILAVDREVTRLGESVFRTGRLSEDAMRLACTVLARMAQRYRSLNVSGVRAVATSSVRDARNQAEFLRRASEACGAPVEVISGREEARLIQMGVVSRWPNAGDRVLIIDIGGGSAEIICSEGGHMRQAVSLPLGAIRLQEVFLEHDPPLEHELEELDEYIAERLQGLARRFGSARWDRAIATSATAAATVSAIAGLPRSRRDTADRVRASTAGVRRLLGKLRGMSVRERRRVPGIGPRRAEIIVPGVWVLAKVLQTFGLSSVYYSNAGVRDGIIADLAARGVGKELARLHGDERREVERMSLRFGVERHHAKKVAALAASLFEYLQPLHRLPPAYGRLLEAAGFLHDIGHFISDSSHHKHAYYVVSNSDMPGFTSNEREFIANLCRYHRKALPATEHANQRQLDSEERKALWLLIPLLRLADALDRGHQQRVDSVSCAIRDGSILVELRASSDITLQRWAAGRVSELFRRAYGRPIVVTGVSR